jgi:hypothetical protein
MVLNDTDNVHVAETDEELLTFDVSDDALERAVPHYRRGSLRGNAEFWHWPPS